MGTVADKLNKLLGTKADIKAAITEKGQTVAEADTFASYGDKIRAIKTGAEPGTPLDPVEVYKSTRPSDWLPMPTPADDEMYLLFHILNGSSALLAFTVACTGTYTVALGTVTNGVFVQKSSQSIASNTTYEAELIADDYGDITSDGRKQVMVKISGADIRVWQQSAHSKKRYPSGFSGWNIVEIACRLPKVNKICGFNSLLKSLTMLKYFSCYGSNELVDASYTFFGCYSLVCVLELDTSKTSVASGMFNGCNSLLAIPQLDTANITNMRSMFSSCSRLTAIPHLNTSNVTNMSYTWSGCTSLAAIPQIDTSSVTEMTRVFENCKRLQTIPHLTLSKAINVVDMFQFCESLRSIPPLDTSNVHQIGIMFNGCYSLLEIPQLNTMNLENSRGGGDLIIQNCYSLARVTLDPSVTGWAGTEISIKNASLNHQAIVDLFNSLPTITSTKNLDLSGNPGVTDLTDADKAIATNKNWTLSL